MHRATLSEETASAASTIWHLCWQAAVGRDFFAHPHLYSRIRDRLIDAHHRPGRVLIDYLLLPTEIHVISEIPPSDTAGGVARAVGNVVARWVRELEAVRSPVLAGPYLAHRIGSTNELRSEVRMLAWHPVLRGFCATPTHYSHGGLRVSLGLAPGRGFNARTALNAFGEAVPEARAALRTWISKRPTQREWMEWELTRGLVLAPSTVGSQPMMAKEVRGAAAAALIAAGGPSGIDGALRLLEIWVAAKLGLHGVLELRNVPGVTGANARALVGCLAVQHELCSAASVARFFRRAKATLSEQMKACRGRVADQNIVRTPASRILEEAVALRHSKARAAQNG